MLTILSLSVLCAFLVVLFVEIRRAFLLRNIFERADFDDSCPALNLQGAVREALAWAAPDLRSKVLGYERHLPLDFALWADLGGLRGVLRVALRADKMQRLCLLGLQYEPRIVEETDSIQCCSLFIYALLPFCLLESAFYAVLPRMCALPRVFTRAFAELYFCRLVEVASTVEYYAYFDEHRAKQKMEQCVKELEAIKDIAQSEQISQELVASLSARRSLLEADVAKFRLAASPLL